MAEKVDIPTQQVLFDVPADVLAVERANLRRACRRDIQSLYRAYFPKKNL